MPRNCLNLRTVVGTGNCMMPCKFESKGTMPFSETLCPKYCTSFLRRNVFAGLILNPVSLNADKTFSRTSKCSSNVSLRIRTSSKYTMHSFHGICARAYLIPRWKVAGPFFTPNGIRRNSQWDNGVVNAVFFNAGLLHFHLIVAFYQINSRKVFHTLQTK